MSRTLLLALLLLSPAAARADDVSLESDPVPWILSGYDVVAGYRPAALPHLRFIGSVMRLSFPDLLLEDGWEAELQGYTLHGQYFFRPGGRGFMTGLQLALLDLEVERAGAATSFQQLDVAALFGYRWFPFDRGLFLVGWFKLGVPITVGGSDEIDGERYPSRPVSFYPSVHLGYEVEL